MCDERQKDAASDHSAHTSLTRAELRVCSSSSEDRRKDGGTEDDQKLKEGFELHGTNHGVVDGSGDKSFPRMSSWSLACLDWAQSGYFGLRAENFTYCIIASERY